MLKFRESRTLPAFPRWFDNMQYIAAVHYLYERSPTVREAALKSLYVCWQQCRFTDDQAVIGQVMLPVFAHVACDLHADVRRTGLHVLGRMLNEVRACYEPPALL